MTHTNGVREAIGGIVTNCPNCLGGKVSSYSTTSLYMNCKVCNGLGTSKEKIDQILSTLATHLLSRMPERSKISKRYSTSMVDRMTYDQGFNDCLDEITTIIKSELQKGDV